MPTSPTQVTSKWIWLPAVALLGLTLPESLFILAVGLLGELGPSYLSGGLAIPLACSALVALGLGTVQASRTWFSLSLALATGFPVCVGLLATVGIPGRIARGESVWENVRYASWAFVVSGVPLVFALATRAVRRLLSER